MTVRARRRVNWFFGLVVAIGTFGGQALAQDTASPGEKSGAVPPDAAARAREHFQKARDLYGAGAYKAAIVELEAARGLDPTAKDLVFNLGVVNEKLGQIEDALKYFKLYAQMDLSPAERARGDAYIKRLSGAKREVTAAPTATATVAPPPPPPPPEPPPPSRGRIDAATVAAGAAAVAGIGVGIVFGLKALADSPKSNFVTGPDGTYGDLQNQTSASHREATLADIGFGVGVAATLLTAYLYFGRTKGQASPPVGASVSGLPIAGGGAVVLRGNF